jgi:Na+-translocating ferredoxin:NAD+ oxidoreductase RnfD subunit
MEISGIYKYTLIDQIFGHSVGGLYSTNSFLIILSLIFLLTDTYYKKEIPLYSYGLYIIILMFTAIIKQDMSFFLLHICNSSVLFALVFIATLSLFSPYTKKRTLIYSVLIGLLIIPLSLYFNFNEGVYIAILIANIVVIIWGLLEKL